MRRAKRRRKMPVYDVQRCWCGHTARGGTWVVIYLGNEDVDTGAMALRLPSCAFHRSVKSWPPDVHEAAAVLTFAEGVPVPLADVAGLARGPRMAIEYDDPPARDPERQN